ncbi:MAG TPA: hypothetical protein VIA10_07500 [Gaiellaceae bacterium]|jgi:Tol biopolymer transport system component
MPAARSIVAVLAAALLCASAGDEAEPTRIAVANADTIVVMRADGTARRILRTLPMIGGDVALSSDRRTVAYASLTGIRLVDAATGRSSRLRTPPGVAIDPIFARRSRTLYFLHSPSSTRVRYDLWSSALSGRLTRHTRGADLQMIDVSADERRVVFARDFSERGGRIYVAGLDARAARQIATGFNPSLSPDGRQVVYTADDGIRLVGVEGGRSRLVGSRGDHATFSPDGSSLAFLDYTRCLDHAYCLQRVFVAPAAGGRARPAGPELADPGRLAWR